MMRTAAPFPSRSDDVARCPGRDGRPRRGEACCTILLVALLPLLAGCGDSGLISEPPPPPPVLDESQLTFLRQAADAPGLLTLDTSFVATRGEETEIEIFYAPEEGSDEERGERFLELELDDESLLRYPAGHPRAGATFVAGDTITIRIQVDPERLIATMEPSGLVFDEDEPAELELRYLHADDDFDEDGEPDPELEDEIDLWRQERPGDPWVRVGEIKDADRDGVRARLTSFSRYALAI